MRENEMVGWHHQLNGHVFEQTPGDSEEQGSLVCYSPWGCKELDMTQQLIISYCTTQVEARFSDELDENAPRKYIHRSLTFIL